MSKIHSEGGYCEIILEKLWQQCESEDLCDVVLLAGTEEKRIPAHRLILSVASEYFRGMFSSSMCESTKKVIELPSVDGDVLKNLVEYCYKGRVVISEDIVVEMLKTADMLLLRNVVIVCANFLEDQLHPSNCLGLAILAEQHCCETLFKNAKDYCLGYFSDVCKTDEFFNLNAEHLSKLLARDNLYVYAEEEVFKSVMQWIEYDPDKREKYKEELLGLVRMPLLERSFFYEHVKPICTSVECIQIYMAAIEPQFVSDKKKVTSRSSTLGDGFLLAITLNKKLQKVCIHYYCPQLKWMKWLKQLECRQVFDVAVMAEHVYIVGVFKDQNTTGVYLNLKTMSSRHMNKSEHFNFGNRIIILKDFLYLIGGLGSRSVERWDPKTDSWSNVASMSTTRYNFGTAILNEKIYVFGGRLLRTAEYFDSDKNLWTNIASMSTDRVQFGVAILNEKIYVFGGQSEKGELNTAEYYDPDKNMWQRIAHMNQSRISPGVAVVKGLLYVVGGCEFNHSIELYDPETNNWIMICSLSEKLCKNVTPKCTTFRNKLVVESKKSFEVYDPETNEWEAIAALNAPKDILYRVFSCSVQPPISEFEESYLLNPNRSKNLFL